MLRGEVMAYMVPCSQKPAEPDPAQADEEGDDFAGDLNSDWEEGDEDDDLDFEADSDPERIGQGPTVAGRHVIGTAPWSSELMRQVTGLDRQT